LARRPPEPSRRQVLYGLHPVAEALRARRRPLYRLWVRHGRGEGPALRRIQARARALGLSVEEEQEAVFRKRVPETANDQGVALEVGPLPELSLGELAGLGETPRRLVALDGVEDPQNVGAIARVAESHEVAALVKDDRVGVYVAAAAGPGDQGYFPAKVKKRRDTAFF